MDYTEKQPPLGARERSYWRNGQSYAEMSQTVAEQHNQRANIFAHQVVESLIGNMGDVRDGRGIPLGNLDGDMLTAVGQLGKLIDNPNSPLQDPPWMLAGYLTAFQLLSGLSPEATGNAALYAGVARHTLEQFQRKSAITGVNPYVELGTRALRQAGIPLPRRI